MRPPRAETDFRTEIKQYERIGGLLDELYILAEAVAAHTENDGSLPIGLYDQIEDLEDRLKEAGSKMVVSGEGFVPFVMPEGDEETIYSNITLTSATFVGLEPVDAEAVEHMSQEDLEDEVEEDSGSLLQDDEILAHVTSKLKTPPEGLQLYAEFLLNASDNEEPVAGDMVRARGIARYMLLHAAKLEFNWFGNESTPTIDEDTVLEYLHTKSRHIYQATRATKFRRGTKKHQRSLIDTLVHQINDELQIDRFAMMAHPANMIVPDTSNENFRLIVPDSRSYDYSFSVRPIRVDSLEAFKLHEGQAIRNDSHMISPEDCGLCVVAEIDEAMQIMLRLPSPVVWIPVIFPRSKKGDTLPYFDNHFELVDTE